MSYCTTGENATINIIYPEKITITSKNAPVNVNIEYTNQGLFENYSHTMNTPINKGFSKPIASVALIDPLDTYVFSGEYPPNDPRVQANCPIPAIQGNQIYLDFDPGFYDDNSGTCGYKVYFGGYQITITDTSGQIFAKTYEVIPEFNVECGNCPPGYIKCECDNYPGYCCISCNELRTGINEAKQSVRSLINNV